MEVDNQTREKPKKHSNLKFVAYFLIVIIATAISLVTSLWGSFDAVKDALLSAKPLYLVLIVLIVALSYVIEGLIVKIFCRLYTRHYHWSQGISATLVGTFYNDVTPASSGGQVMEAFTLKQQGIQVSNAASIMVMWFILYQTSLIGFDIIAFIVERNTILKIAPVNVFGWEVPMLPLIIVGFLLNLSIIVMLYLMSFSHKIHNFILHYVIGFLGKIHLVKNPDKMRENIRVQVENFKIELRRLQANIPVTILIVVLFFIVLLCRNCIPYFCALSLDAVKDSGETFSFSKMMDFSFLGSFQQMITGLIPIPGSAGVSEYFFYYLFYNSFDNTMVNGEVIRTLDQNLKASQILWRTATFHIVLLVTGIFASLYRSRPKEAPRMASRQTFVNLQLETFEERKKSADTMYETSQLSKMEIQKRLQKSLHGKKNDEDQTRSSAYSNEKDEAKPTKIKKSRKKKKDDDFDDWGDIDIDS